MADVSVTAASVVRTGGTPLIDGILASTTTAGQTAYDTVAGTAPPTYGLCDANGTTPADKFVGIFATGGAAGQPCKIIPAGATYNPGFTATVGEIYVTTVTAGGIALADDLASGWKTAIVGVALSTTSIYVIGYASETALTA